MQPSEQRAALLDTASSPTMQPSDQREALLDTAEAVPVGIPVVPQIMARESAPMAHWRDMLSVESPGLLMRERISLLQFMFGACEKRTSFAVGAYPNNADATVLHAHLDDGAFQSALVNGLFEVREESTCLCRYCCHQNRELRIGIFPARRNMPGSLVDVEVQGGLGGLGWPEGEVSSNQLSAIRAEEFYFFFVIQVPSLEFFRPFKCTVPCCCCLLHPQEIRALDTSTSSPLGGTKMDWSCWFCVAPLLCVPRLRYTVHDEAGKPEHEVHVPACFADQGLNCCAPTCFNSVFVMPITAPGDKAEIGSVQSHWPGCNVRGLCCAGNANNNYAVVFPPSATPEQKARLLSAVHLIDLNMFERRQNQK